MRHRKIVCGILSLLVFSTVLSVAGMSVSATEKKVLLSKTYDIQDTYQMEVSLNSGGSFFDGEKEIIGGKESIVYNLPLGEDSPNYKEFEIRPASGYRLIDLIYTEPDIDPDKSISLMDQVKDGKFSLPVKSTRMVLTAIFEKIEDGSGSGSQGGNTGGSGSGGTSGGSGTGGSSTSDGNASGGTGNTGSTSSSSAAGSQSVTSSVAGTATGTKTGDASTAEWYLLMMLIAVAVLVVAREKKLKVYKES